LTWQRTCEDPPEYTQPAPIQVTLEMQNKKSSASSCKETKDLRFRGTTPVHTLTGMHSCEPGHCHPDPPVLTARLRLRLLRQAHFALHALSGLLRGEFRRSVQPLRTNQRLSGCQECLTAPLLRICM